MQGQSAPQQPGKPALRSGAVMGITVGVVQSVITIISTEMTSTARSTSSGTTPSTTIILYLVSPILWIVGMLISGAWASRETGKIGTGTLAGLFAGTFGGIIAALGQVIATALVINQQNTSSEQSSLLLFSGFATMFYVILLAIGAGAGFGALGGLIGQSMSNVRIPPPIPAQPVYPAPAMSYGYVPAQQVPLPPQQPSHVPASEQAQVPPFPEQ